MPHLSVSQYLAMLEAGYSAEELDKYNREQSSPAPVPDPAPAIANPVPDPAPAISNTVPDPAPAAPGNQNEEARQLVAEMHDLVALMRNANLRNINMPTDPPPDPARIAASILAPRNNTKEVK